MKGAAVILTLNMQKILSFLQGTPTELWSFASTELVGYLHLTQRFSPTNVEDAHREGDQFDDDVCFCHCSPRLFD